MLIQQNIPSLPQIPQVNKQAIMQQQPPSSKQLNITKLKQPIITLPNPYLNPISNKFQQSKQPRGRSFGITLLVVQIGFLIAYGINGSFYQEMNINKAAYAQIYACVILAMMVIIGCGLMLSIYRYGSWLGITTAIIVVAISILLSPLLQKLWFSIIITKFGNDNMPNIMGTNIQNYWQHLTRHNIQISSIINRNTLLSCLSIMIVMTGIIGRINLQQIFKITIIFQIFWNLCYNLLIYLAVVVQPGANIPYTPYIFDQFGSTYTYLFATCFGIVVTNMMYHQRMLSTHQRNQHSRKTLILSLLGTIFIFASFCFSYSNVIQYVPRGKNLGIFNIFWGMIGSIAGSYMLGFILKKGKVGIKQIIAGTINGGIILSGVSCVIHNIGISIMLGIISGIFSTFFVHTLQPKINRTYLNDSLGLLLPFLFSSFISAILILPLSLYYYFQNKQALPGIDSSYPQSIISWQIIYVAVSIGFGLIGGILSGLACLCDRQNYGLGSNGRIFSNDYGLYAQQQIDQQFEVLNKFFSNKGKLNQPKIIQIPLASTNIKIQ